MSLYKYKAISAEGERVSGTVEAGTEYEAIAQIREEYPTVVQVRPTIQKRNFEINLNEPLNLSDKVLSVTASQFSILLKAGLPLVRTLEIVAKQTADLLMKRILTNATKDVSAGYSLAQSLERQGKKIPAAFIEAVRAGESSGTLEQSFAKLTVYYEKTGKIKGKVRGAMMYPLFLSLLATVVIAVVITFTVPVLGGMIAESGGALPLPTRILIAASEVITKWWWLLIVGLLILVGGIWLYGKSVQGKERLARLALNLPLIGKINTLNAASQFAGTLATLTGAGLPLTKALQITGHVLDNEVVGKSVEECAKGIEEGKRLGEVLRNNPYLPPLLTEMTSIGEEAGALEQTLETIGAYYDNEVEQASAKALAMLEPLITVVMGLVIGFIVIALYLPMFTMYSAM